MAGLMASGMVVDRAVLAGHDGLVITHTNDNLHDPVFFSFDHLGRVLTQSPHPAVLGSPALPTFPSIPPPYHPPRATPLGRLPPLPHLSTESGIYRSAQPQPNSRPRTLSHPYANPNYSPTHSRRDSAQSDESDYPPSPTDRRPNHRHNNSTSTIASADDEPTSATSSRPKGKTSSSGAPTPTSQSKPSTESISVVREMIHGFDFLWSASLGRCVSPAAVSSSSMEQPMVVRFQPGGWFHVYDAEGEVWPWVNLNGWIKGQAKESKQCVCSFQWFKNGKELGKKGLQDGAIWKRPAVLREHLAHCQKLEPTNPLVIVARWTREGDKLKGGDNRPAPSRTGR